MRQRQGFTLMEIIVVLLIIAIASVVILPNFSTSMEQARAKTAQNNLLAIYSAQQNYINNTGAYCNNTVTVNLCDSLSDINTDLSLNIQDDGTYAYQCLTATTCTAKRNINPTPLTLTLTLNAALQAGNPTCAPAAGDSNWCP